MSNELIPSDILGDVSTAEDDAMFEDLGSSTKYLQRLELKSKGLLIDTGKVSPGHYCIIKSGGEADDLGDSIDILVLARKPKAIDMSDSESIVVNFDRESDVFKDIEQRAGTKDSRCQYGATFLIIERSTGKMFEFFCGSASSRREIPAISEFMAITAAQIKARGLKGVKPHGILPVNLKSKIAQNKKMGYTWFVPVIRPCSNPFTKDQIPKPEAIKEAIEKFQNPETVGPEVETNKGKTRDR